MRLDDMVHRGELDRLPPTVGEIPALLKTIDRRIEDAANPTNHPETRLEQAYTAIFNCALVALRAEGARPARGTRQHIYTLESLRFTVGVDAQRLDTYQTLRSLRHRGLYEGFTDVSESQAEEAVEEARWLQDRLAAWLADRHPELIKA
jgi:hypothetical protein